MNTLNIPAGWLKRLNELSGSSYVTIDADAARGYAKIAQAGGYKLVLVNDTLGVYGYEHSEGFSWLFFKIINSDRMVACHAGGSKKGLRANIAEELGSLWYSKCHSTPAAHDPFVTTYHPIAGWKAILMTWDDELNCYVPEQTGYFGYENESDAIAEAKAWSESEEIAYKARA